MGRRRKTGTAVPDKKPEPQSNQQQQEHLDHPFTSIEDTAVTIPIPPLQKSRGNGRGSVTHSLSPGSLGRGRGRGRGSTPKQQSPLQEDFPPLPAPVQHGVPRNVSETDQVIQQTEQLHLEEQMLDTPPIQEQLQFEPILHIVQDRFSPQICMKDQQYQTGHLQPLNQTPPPEQQYQQFLQMQYQIIVPLEQQELAQLTPPLQHFPEPHQVQYQRNQHREDEMKTDDVKVVPQTALDDPEEVPSNFRRGGCQGKKIKVLANHFPLRLSPNITKAYQYDVTIEPDKPRKLLPLVMQQMQRNYYPKNFPAYDGMRNLMSAYELPLALPYMGVVHVLEDDREKEYRVKIQLASIVDLTALTRFFNQGAQNQMLPPMHVLQCLDIVLRSRPSTSMITAGRSYFSVPEEIVTLGNGMEMYRGFFQSAILGWKPFLNVDVSHKAFPSQVSIIDLIMDIDRRADLTKLLSRYTENKLAKFVYSLKIEYMIPSKTFSKRTFRVNGLEKNANHFTFKNDKGVEMTVADYFSSEKHYRLKYPNLPCLWVGSKQRKPRMVLPCELCTILGGQVTNHKMDDIQTRNMIRNATTTTTVRKEHIMQSMRLANHNISPVMQEFGLSIDPSMTEVIARILKPPTIKYGNQKIQTVSRGAWKSSNFINAIHVGKWSILCLDDNIVDRQIFELKDMMIRQGRMYGMHFGANAKSTRIKLNQTYGFKDIYKYLEKSKQEQVEIVIVILLDTNSNCYGWIKKAAELHIGALTQCIRALTVAHLTLPTMDNILLKVNSKLNGTNHVLGERPALMRRPVMIMGADVTHPSPEARENAPSVAAVTASQDPQAIRYNIVWRLQDPRAEIITDLETITKEQLMIFYNKTSYKPERIIFYRDGVSDGQFEAVRKKEIQAVRNACISLNPEYKPAITFLVVQKRHHTRLFPSDPKDSDDRNGNVPAGTCVDTLITHPTAQDFYLVSHASVQGVAKPTKYRTIWDDSNLSDDDIEQLTYYLCYLFNRCNKSVSYPAPTYYAHLAAARAKIYIEDQRLDLSDLKKLHKQINIVDEIQKDHPMFFI